MDPADDVVHTQSFEVHSFAVSFCRVKPRSASSVPTPALSAGKKSCLEANRVCRLWLPEAMGLDNPCPNNRKNASNVEWDKERRIWLSNFKGGSSMDANSTSPPHQATWTKQMAPQITLTTTPFIGECMWYLEALRCHLQHANTTSNYRS